MKDTSDWSSNRIYILVGPGLRITTIESSMSPELAAADNLSWEAGTGKLRWVARTDAMLAEAGCAN